MTGSGYTVPRKHLDKLFAAIIGFVIAVLGGALPLPGTPRQAQENAAAALSERIAVVETELRQLRSSVDKLSDKIDARTK